MTDTIRDQVKKLVDLQKLDFQIYGFKRELREKPPYLAKLKEDFEAKKNKLKQLEDKYKSVQVGRNAQEVELKANEDSIAKANAQLSLIKTNKEYTAKLTEIENFKVDKARTEEKILVFYDEADTVKAQMDQEKVVVAEEEKKYLAEKSKMEAEVKDLEDKIKIMDVQRQQLTPGVEKIHLSRYEKLVVNKDGLAIVPVTGGVCGGCYMNVPQQVLNEIKMHENLIYCEICARILYLEEDL